MTSPVLTTHIRRQQFCLFLLKALLSDIPLKRRKGGEEGREGESRGRRGNSRQRMAREAGEGRGKGTGGRGEGRQGSHQFIVYGIQSIYMYIVHDWIYHSSPAVNDDQCPPNAGHTTTRVPTVHLHVLYCETTSTATGYPIRQVDSIQILINLKPTLPRTEIQVSTTDAYFTVHK